jgi:hypothetical protein
MGSCIEIAYSESLLRGVLEMEFFMQRRLVKIVQKRP